MFLSAVAIYLILGLIFGLAFIVRGYRAIDSAAEGAGILVRFMWLTASVLLWPYLLKRWLSKPNDQIKQMGGEE